MRAEIARNLPPRQRVLLRLQFIEKSSKYAPVRPISYGLWPRRARNGWSFSTTWAAITTTPHRLGISGRGKRFELHTTWRREQLKNSN